MRYMILLTAIFCLCSMAIAEISEFSLHSSDSGAVTDQHGGRPYHVFDGPDDEAVYITATDWQGGHDPTEPVVWPVSDGFVNWSTIEDPNGSTGRPEVMAYNADGELAYLYWNEQKEEYELHDSPDMSDGTIKKLCYEEYKTDVASLNFGNNGVPDGGFADRQNVLITEFKLERALEAGLDENTLVSAYIELTIDDIVDMTLNGNNMALIPSKMFVNSFIGDGVLNRYENVQAAFDLIDHENSDNEVWLTLDNTEAGWNITDWSLSYYKYVSPGLGEQYKIRIDVTGTLLSMLQNNADYAGYIFSGSSDGEFTLASLDLVDRDGTNYLPKLIITADIPELYADLDGDGAVDLTDFALFAYSWSCTEGDQAYSEKCDMAEPADGIINVIDLESFVSQWLK